MAKKSPDTQQPTLLDTGPKAEPKAEDTKAEAPKTEAKSEAKSEVVVVETRLAKAEEVAPARPVVVDGDVYANFDLSPEMQEQLAEMDPGLDSSDCKVPYIVFNIQKEFTAADGQTYRTRRDQFVNTQTDEVMDEIEVVLMFRLKTNEWSFFDQSENKKVRICFSSDQRHGEMIMDMGDLKKGQRRRCEKCPQATWREAEDPKTRKPVKILDCAEVQNFILIQPDTMAPGMMRFKRSSAPAARDMVAKYIQGKRHVIDPKSGASKRADYPWFTFRFKITLKMDPGNKYAIPTFTMIRPLSKDEFPAFLEQAQFLKKYMNDAMRIADKTEEQIDHETNEETGAFDPRRLGPSEDSAPPSEPGRNQVVESKDEF